MTAIWNYSEADFIYETRWNESSFSALSKFDEALLECWRQKENENLFRYKLNVKKHRFLSGNYRLFLQLNPERAVLRRAPESFESFHKPFNADSFNFTKIQEAEKMFELRKSSETDPSDETKNILAINVSPIQYGHTLILPSLYKCLPQVMTKESLRVSLDIILLSASPSCRIVYNSPCAYASVNHLHFHLLYLDEKMLLETIEVEHLSGPCYELTNYPGKGFMFELSKGTSNEALVSDVFKLISLLQKRNVAHNLCMTRGCWQKKSVSNMENERNCIRIYVWCRSPNYGSKAVWDINPAAAELFGLFSLKNSDLFESISEEEAAKILIDITDNVFWSIRNDVKLLFLTT